MSSNTEAAFCEFCKPLPAIAIKLETIIRIPYHKNIEALKASAFSGCALCAWIVENLPDYTISRIKYLRYSASQQVFSLQYLVADFDIPRMRQDQVKELENMGVYFRICYCNGNLSNLFYRLLELRKRVGRPPASKDDISGRNICVNPVEAISTVALPWIATCKMTHEACQQLKRLPLPTRVLKVGEAGEDVVLIDSQGLEDSYTILSYCWGKVVTLKTTPDTIAAWKCGIPYDDLPLTLKHAVKVTRQLQIKYLWIDALCIIQDQEPPTDWLIESGKMLDYYRNAYVTIGNLDGEASSSGFLFPRKAKPLKVPGNKDLAFRRVSIRQYWSIYDHSVLATRAWCFQERLVSTRLLLFGKDEMYWECRTCCEREGIMLTGQMNVKYTASLQGKRIEEIEHEMIQIMASLGSDRISLRDCMNIWYTIVEQYTSRHLTRATDILVAISGVAMDIQRRTSNDYIHGLWKQDLCKGLAWSRRPGGQVTGAPSWSWASKTGLVGFKALQISEDINFNTTFEDQIEIQRTSNGDRELHVRAKCRQVDLDAIIKDRKHGRGVKTNIHSFWEGIDGRDYVELDEHDENLPKTVCKAMNILLRYSYIIEAGTDCELLLSGYFAVSYLLLALDETQGGKWKRIGLGTFHRNIESKELRYEDISSGYTFQADQLRPQLLFDNCAYENLCLI